MDLRPAQTWNPPDDWARITVIDAHTGGEPFRTVIAGAPSIPGAAVLDRRRFAMTELDWLRRILMWEPRGHADMYGGLVGPPERSDSDFSVLFMHNSGFSTMCGHGIIALAKVVLDLGLVECDSDTARLDIDTPAGQIHTCSSREEGLVTSTSFTNVASFVTALDVTVDVGVAGKVVFDVAYGGAFYAYVDAGTVGIDLDNPAALITAGRAIKSAVSRLELTNHPESEDLSFLYGVIFTGPAESKENHSRQVCVFADGEIDRSPTGTGVSARLALLREREGLAVGETVVIESIVGSTFSGKIDALTKIGDRPAIIPEITGSAHIVGRSEFWIDPSDTLGEGFLLR